MRIWGYLLIFLNLVVSAVFVYFATAVWQKRSEWQYAFVKQELINRGLPLEASAGPADDDYVPFVFEAGPTRLTQISKKKLGSLIPQGGDVLGAGAGTIISNQTDEVKRVEKIVFADLDKMNEGDKRKHLMILLLNLSTGTGREGVFALLRDYPDETRRERARADLAFLGRTASQTVALRAFAALSDVAIAFGPNIAFKDKDKRIKDGRAALAEWARSEVYNATPNPLPPTVAAAPVEGAPAEPANENRRNLLSALNPFLTEVKRDTPDKAKIEAGKQRLTRELLEGEQKLTNPEAALLVPYLAEIAGNLLNTPLELAEAKAKLLELLQLRATTESEKKAIAAIADLMIPRSNEAQAEKAQREQYIDVAATELLRAYFEEAGDKASASPTQKPLRDPGDKKDKIAHLLYHLDAHLGGTQASRNAWFSYFVTSDAGDKGQALPPYDVALSGKRAEWHSRVVAIVGFETYITAVEAQAAELQKTADRLRGYLLDEQNKFERRYQTIVQETLAVARLLFVRQSEVKEQEALFQEAVKNLTIRMAEQNDLEIALASVTVTAKKSLEELETKVDELFQITKQLGEAQDALIGLESRLRDLELPNKQKR